MTFKFNSQPCPVSEYCENSILCAMRDWEYIDEFAYGDINGIYEKIDIYKKGIYRLVHGRENLFAKKCFKSNCINNGMAQEEINSSVCQLDI